MENYILTSFMKSVSKDLVTADQNFVYLTKHMKRLAKACRSNSSLLFWTNVALLGTGFILYIQDKQIMKLQEDVEQLKSGGETEVKAE